MHDLRLGLFNRLDAAVGFSCSLLGFLGLALESGPRFLTIYRGAWFGEDSRGEDGGLDDLPQGHSAHPGECAMIELRWLCGAITSDIGLASASRSSAAVV